MYVCFLDATKAFDRVDYAVLFQKLLSRNVPGYIVIFHGYVVIFLWNWYSKHCARILWAGILSDIASTFAMVCDKEEYYLLSCLQFILTVSSPVFV